MIIVDASVIVALLLKTDRAISFPKILFARHQTIHAPHLLDAEVLHALRRHDLGGRIPTHRADQAVVDFVDIRISRHSHLPLLDRVWELRHILTAYDACYVALAEYLQAPLVTLDEGLSRSKGHSAQIELIS